MVPPFDGERGGRRGWGRVQWGDADPVRPLRLRSAGSGGDAAIVRKCDGRPSLDHNPLADPPPPSAPGHNPRPST